MTVFWYSILFLFDTSKLASNSSISLSNFLRPFCNSPFVRSSLSIVAWRDSSCRRWFLRPFSSSSSFSAILRSLVCFNCVNSSWILRNFASSWSRAPSASSSANCSSSFSWSSFRRSLSSSTEFFPPSLSCSVAFERSAEN